MTGVVYDLDHSWGPYPPITKDQDVGFSKSMGVLLVNMYIWILKETMRPITQSDYI